MRQRCGTQLELIKQKEQEMIKKHDNETDSLKFQENKFIEKERECENRIRDLDYLKEMTTKKIQEEIEL